MRLRSLIDSVPRAVTAAQGAAHDSLSTTRCRQPLARCAQGSSARPPAHLAPAGGVSRRTTGAPAASRGIRARLRPAPALGVWSRRDRNAAPAPRAHRATTSNGSAAGARSLRARRSHTLTSRHRTSENEPSAERSSSRRRSGGAPSKPEAQPTRRGNRRGSRVHHPEQVPQREEGGLGREVAPQQSEGVLERRDVGRLPALRPGVGQLIDERQFARRRPGSPRAQGVGYRWRSPARRPGDAHWWW